MTDKTVGALAPFHHSKAPRIVAARRVNERAAVLASRGADGVFVQAHLRTADLGWVPFGVRVRLEAREGEPLDAEDVRRVLPGIVAGLAEVAGDPLRFGKITGPPVLPDWQNLEAL